VGSRILGVDYGEVRIGLALDDPLGLTAQPLETLARSGDRRDAQRIGEIVTAHGVGRIVIGLPLLMSGREGRAAERTRKFAAALRRGIREVRVQMWDERLTTALAERTMIQSGVRRRKRRGIVDRVAAVLILQSFLDAGKPEDSEPAG
jgi:putative Holliday junction resolvase